MSATIEISGEELNKVSTSFRAIAQGAHASALDVLRGEAGIILKGCAALTSVATAPKADKRSNKRFLRGLELTGNNPGIPVTVSAGVKKGSQFGRVFLRTNKGGWRRTHEANFRPVAGMPSDGRKKPGDHYSEHDWLLLKSTIQTVKGGVTAARAAGRKTIGLARQSWIQIGDALGIPLETVKGGRVFGKNISSAAIIKARGAVAGNGQRYVNGLGTEQRKTYETIITLINRYPRAYKLKMDATLRSVLHARVAFFEKNLSLGVFNRIRDVCRAYPYLQFTS